MSNPASEGCCLLIVALIATLLLVGCTVFERYEAPYSGATLEGPAKESQEHYAPEYVPAPAK